jgi:putative transposase
MHAPVAHPLRGTQHPWRTPPRNATSVRGGGVRERLFSKARNSRGAGPIRTLMTAPREILPGRDYLVSRRCTQRQFLLRPDEDTNSIFAYCLAEAAARHGIVLIAWLAMSNHYHAVVHDSTGKLPAFLEHFHKMLAKAMNAYLGRWENFWSSEETCVTFLPTPEDVFDKVVYTLSNPVNGHLVDRASDWPGCSSLSALDGEARKHSRPRWFFKAGGKIMPASVQLRAIQSPSIGRESRAAWAGRVREAIAVNERAARAARLRKRIKLVSRKGVLATSAFASPKTSTDRRKLRPCVASKDETRRNIELAKLKGFRVHYKRVRLLFAAGQRKVEFPPGTYRLWAWGVRIASADPVPIRTRLQCAGPPPGR